MEPLAAELLHPAPGVALLVLVGEARALDADDLAASVRIAGDGAQALVIDLTELVTADAAIAEALLDAERDGRVDGRVVHVVLPAASALAAVLRTSGLDAALRLHETRATALRAAAS